MFGSTWTLFPSVTPSTTRSYVCKHPISPVNHSEDNETLLFSFTILSLSYDQAWLGLTTTTTTTVNVDGAAGNPSY